MSTARIVVFDRLGGPEVLEVKDLPVAEPNAGEVRLRVQAIGLKAKSRKHTALWNRTSSWAKSS